jgi:hypothetical protein
MPLIQTQPLKEIKSVRYIKLGRAGGWTKDCLKEGTIRIGFDTDRHLDICSSGQWDRLKACYQNEGFMPARATSRCNQVRAYFEDAGDTLWITFHDTLLWWAIVDPGLTPKIAADSDGTTRKTISGWHSTNVLGESLHMSNLAGHLTQLMGFQGTSCASRDVEYVVRRLNGQRSPEAEEAERLSRELGVAVQAMITKLTPKDFELLVDLIFSTSGWRRLGVTGGTQKTMDMELLLPTTSERAFVQVKSQTTQNEFEEEYRDVFARMDQYKRMFYAYHTGNITCADSGITLLDSKKLSSMVLDAGLVSWLIQRVS